MLPIWRGAGLNLREATSLTEQVRAKQPKQRHDGPAELKTHPNHTHINEINEFCIVPVPTTPTLMEEMARKLFRPDRVQAEIEERGSWW